MMPIAIAYGRKSFDDPENRTSSVDDQELFARNYAQQHGLEFLNFFSDTGITGATMERPGLQAALAVLKAGKAHILIIEDVDRLGRDQEHLSFMRKLFAAYDVVVHTVAAGKLDELTFSFKGIMSAQDNKCLAFASRFGGYQNLGPIDGRRVEPRHFYHAFYFFQLADQQVQMARVIYI